MSEDNGNGHYKQKAFDIVPPKSAEQIELEGKAKMAPEIRGGVFKMRLTAPVKFFFAALLDAAFMYKYGGDARGRIWTNVQKLSRLYKHDKDSITKWRDVLIEKKLIWVSKAWPTQEWRICALYPAPEEYRPSHEDYIRGKAGALEEQSGTLPHGVFLPENRKSPSISPGIRNSAPKDSAPVAEDRGTVRGSLPHCKGKVSPNMRGTLPKPEGNPSETCAEDMGKGIPIPSETSAEGIRTTKETPLGVSGVLERSLSCSTDEKGSRKPGPARKAEPFSGSTASKIDLADEKEWLKQFGEIAVHYPSSAKELTNWGGMWRNKIREDSEKAWRVLAEIQRMHKEGLIVNNPGAAALDLWNRFV